MAKTSDLRPATLAAQAFGAIDETTRAIVPPVHVSTTYLRDADGGYRSGRVYGRADNPSFDAPEATLNALEGGAGCLTFASGMAAAIAVFQTLQPGDHVVAPRVMYWALRHWLAEIAESWGISVSFVDASNPDALATAIHPGATKLVWIETPANPTWVITDVARAAELAHGAGARLAVDNTVPTPLLTRPIEHGADLVMHAATKYLNGHSDVIAGALVTAAADEHWERITAHRALSGSILGSFEAWLLLRGMRTVALRVERACQSAQQLAERLETHTGVRAVLYPGLPDHPGHAVAARQMTGGFGGMLSIRLKAGEQAAHAVAAATGIWKPATSLGGVESLIEHRASIEGEGSPAPADLLRLSVGIEDPDDLTADLIQAIESAA
ncbi:MAG TPA: PLP-dependent aspartate aminotransferase family protein [Alphaproteobacteria bacterium]|nr:PLP-dependent aspartate aminotransferase family protein [Alphaproteobacteria bacterium]